MSTGHAKSEPLSTGSMQSRSDSSLRDQALTCSKNQQWAPAVAAWRQIVERYPTDWKALYRACEASFGLGNISDAISLGERAVELSPDDLRPLVFLGRCHSRARNFEAAGQVWARLTADNLALYEAWFRFA
jgi:Flp pilus assembly protein TadD